MDSWVNWSTLKDRPVLADYISNHEELAVLRNKESWHREGLVTTKNCNYIIYEII